MESRPRLWVRAHCLRWALALSQIQALVLPLFLGGPSRADTASSPAPGKAGRRLLRLRRRTRRPRTRAAAGAGVPGLAFSSHYVSFPTLVDSVMPCHSVPKAGNTCAETPRPPDSRGRCTQTARPSRHSGQAHANALESGRASAHERPNTQTYSPTCGQR